MCPKSIKVQDSRVQGFKGSRLRPEGFGAASRPVPGVEDRGALRFRFEAKIIGPY